MPSEVVKQLRIRPVGGLVQPLPIGDDPVTIGRHPDNILRLLDAKSSRHHATVTVKVPGEIAVVKDLNSRNGTMVNGDPVSGSRELKEGDVITIGDTDLLIESIDLSAPDGEAKTRSALSWKGTGKHARQKESADGDVEASESSTREPEPPPQHVRTMAERIRAPRDNDGRSEHKASAAGMPWAGEFLGILKHLPPADQREPIPKVIDARGKVVEGVNRRAEGPVAFLLLLQIASKAHATDIHVEPKGETTHVRMRVDGQMVWIGELPRRVGDLVEGIAKASCAMKSTHREAVLDGHFSARFPDRRVEFRVSFTPSVHGQKLVMRVLDLRDVPKTIRELGLVPYMEAPIRKVTQQDAGMFLVCGPTGSGKTTTLYNALREVDRESKNVVTIEDPVEYQLDGVTQMPIDEQRGTGFNTMLRSVLRQDPDVILVGEIRDEETARTAMQAAMTGHVVFTTVHSKETFGAVFRLLDLGVEPYLVANSLDLVLAQRLVRVLCPHCKRPHPIPPGVASRIGKGLRGATEAYSSTGCVRCLNTGYKGRRALFELLTFDDDLRDVVLNNPSIAAMKKAIRGELFTTLAESGWRLVAEGETSIDEVERVAG